MTQALPSSSSSIASTARPLTPLEQAVRDAIPAPTHFDHNLLAFVDSYAYDDHEQAAADRTRLTAELQGRLVTRLNNETYSFAPEAIFNIIRATEEGAETPLLLACKAALIRGVTSDTGREARIVAQLTEFHAHQTEAFTREGSAYGPTASEFSLFIFRDIARSIKQLEVRKILSPPPHDALSVADMFDFNVAAHTFRMTLEEISDSIIQFSIVDPTGASTLRQDLAARVQALYNIQKTAAQLALTDVSSAVLAELERGAAHASIESRFDLGMRISKWTRVTMLQHGMLHSIHASLMNSAHVPRYRSAGHTLSQSEMTPTFERIEKKTEAIIDGLVQPNPDFDSIILIVKELAKDTHEIRAKLPEMPFNDAFEVRERLYQMLQDFYSAPQSSRAIGTIIPNIIDHASVTLKGILAEIQNQGVPATAEQQAELKNKSAALVQLTAKLMDLHTAVKLL